MKIAFLMLAHKNPDQVARLCRILVAQGDQVFVHIDKSSEIAPFREALAPLGDAVHLLAKRYAIGWGDYSMIRGTNALIDAALPGGFDYFYLLSGQCFPIRPLSWLKEVLEQGGEHIDCDPMPTPTKQMWRLHLRRVNKKGLRYRPRMAAQKLLNIFPVLDFQQTFGLAPYAGWQWWCLSRQTVEHIVAWRRRIPLYDRFMKWTHCPDEMYYHTLVANGLAKASIAPGLTGAVWADERNDHPETLTEDDVPKMMERPIFLARKFEPAAIGALEDRLRVKEGTA